MTDLLAISQVAEEDVRDVVREALREGLDADLLADFVARIDWSGVQQSLPAIAALLGELEAWTTEYAEGDLTKTQFVAQLLSLLPVDQRNEFLATTAD